MIIKLAKRKLKIIDSEEKDEEETLRSIMNYNYNLNDNQKPKTP